MFGLLINPRPHQDESLLGYLQRLAKANGLPRKELLTAFARADETDVADWLQMMEGPLSWPAVSAEFRDPRPKGVKLWTTHHARYCPICLGEAGYWRESWGLTLVTTCSVHGTELHGRCPNCLKETDPSAMSANSCQACGTSLSGTNFEIAPASDTAAWLTSGFEDRFYADSLPADAGLAALTYEQFHELSSRLAVRSLPTERTQPLKVADSGSLEISRLMANAAGVVLMNWPLAFRELLSGLKAVHSDNEHWTLSRSFGPIYHDIHRDLDDSCFDFLRREFESFLQHAWEAPLAKRNRNLSEETIERHRWVSFDSAAEACGLGVSVIKRLHQEGQIAYREKVHEDRVFTVVDLDHLKAISQHLQGVADMKETSTLLSLCRNRVRQLLAGGTLQFFGGEPRPGERWLIDCRSINELIDEKLPTSSDQSLVSINYLAKHSLPKGGGLVELVQAIRAGELRAYGPAENGSVAVGAWLLKPQDFAAWQQARAENKSPVFPGLSVVKAAALLGVKEQCAYAFVRLGLLWSTAVERGRRTQLMVKPQAIDRFRRGYILGPEIAVYLGKSTREAFKHLWEARFRPVAGPSIPNEACRQYVWVRSKKLIDYLASEAAQIDDPEAITFLSTPIAQPRDCRFRHVGSR